jgi:hypothetical protein
MRRDPLAAARALIARGRHAEGLALLEVHFDDPRLGNAAIDAAVGLVRRVHGVEAALPYWNERLGHRMPVPRRRPRARLPRTRRRDDRIRLLVVSHNWNFLGCELDALSRDDRFDLRTLWPGWYVTTPVAAGRGASSLARAPRTHAALLRWADVVFCDWCERPAVWLAECLPARTALCVRLHSHEAHSPFPIAIDWRRVSEAIFVADHIREYLDGRLQISARVRASILAPVHRVADFARAKRPDARWTLGLIGYNSRNKHPMMALEILAKLRRFDRRWRLRLVGHGFGRAPRSESDPAYARAFRRAVDANGLSDAVIVSPFTRDVGRWLTQVGFIIQTLAARVADVEEFRACGRRFADEARRRFDCSVGTPQLARLLRRAAGRV